MSLDGVNKQFVQWLSRAYGESPVEGQFVSLEKTEPYFEPFWYGATGQDGTHHPAYKFLRFQDPFEKDRRVELIVKRHSIRVRLFLPHSSAPLETGGDIQNYNSQCSDVLGTDQKLESPFLFQWDQKVANDRSLPIQTSALILTASLGVRWLMYAKAAEEMAASLPSPDLTKPTVIASHHQFSGSFKDQTIHDALIPKSPLHIAQRIKEKEYYIFQLNANDKSPIVPEAWDPLQFSLTVFPGQYKGRSSEHKITRTFAQRQEIFAGLPTLLESAHHTQQFTDELPFGGLNVFSFQKTINSHGLNEFSSSRDFTIVLLDWDGKTSTRMGWDDPFVLHERFSCAGTLLKLGVHLGYYDPINGNPVEKNRYLPIGCRTVLKIKNPREYLARLLVLQPQRVKSL